MIRPTWREKRLQVGSHHSLRNASFAVIKSRKKVHVRCTGAAWGKWVKTLTVPTQMGMGMGYIKDLGTTYSKSILVLAIQLLFIIVVYTQFWPIPR